MVRVDVFPDGGFSRLHLLGELEEDALSEAIGQWLRLLPPHALAAMLAQAGIDGIGVRNLSRSQLLSLAW